MDRDVKMQNILLTAKGVLKLGMIDYSTGSLNDR